MVHASAPIKWLFVAPIGPSTTIKRLLHWLVVYIHMYSKKYYAPSRTLLDYVCSLDLRKRHMRRYQNHSSVVKSVELLVYLRWLYIIYIEIHMCNYLRDYFKNRSESEYMRLSWYVGFIERFGCVEYDLKAYL